MSYLGTSSGAVCSSIVEHLLMVWWVIGSIPHGGLIELFLIQASAPQLMHVLSCLWDGIYKRSLAAIQKKVTHDVAAAGFLV